MANIYQYSNLETSNQANPKDQQIVIIACGALAKEIMDIIEINRLDHISLTCLPASLHNSPSDIPSRFKAKVDEIRALGYNRIYCGYGDCGTGGMLDKLLTEEGIERLEGPHCYSFFSGNDEFLKQAEEEITSFYLTNFLAKQFEAFVIKPLGLDRHPELIDMYFSNYEKLVYLEQYPDVVAEENAMFGAQFLNLKFEKRQTGYGDLELSLKQIHNQS